MTAARLHIDIEKRLGMFHLRMQLEVGTEILVLFGPSGAGKTQTLQAIAGLMTPDAGEITLDDRTFYRRGQDGPHTNLPARKRRVGYVFQQYALFPHMTALENVAYPLGRQRDARQRARALLDRMRLAHLADRAPDDLSGGQQQRVAIARALAAEPRVLLLDESFSALDLAIRERLHQDLRTLQAEEGLIVIYVTHNLDDAFAVGRRLAVVRDGQVEQVGTLDAVFAQPANRSVLDILGIPNAFAAWTVTATPGGLVLDWDGLLLEAAPQALPPGIVVTAYIRPEDIKILYPNRPMTSVVAHNHTTGTIIACQPGRHLQRLRVMLPNGHAVEVAYPAFAYTTLALRAGTTVQLALRKEKIMLVQPHHSGADSQE